MSTTNPVGSKVFATTQINATTKIVDFVKSGKTDNKTIENSKVLSAVLRFLAAITMPFTMPVSNAIDLVDGLRCIVLNRGINAQIKKVDSIAREILNTSANKPDLVKKKKEEMAAAVGKLQARVENKSKGSFSDKVEFFADAKKVLERDLKAANTDQVKEITSTLVGGAYLTLVKTSANEVAAGFPEINETLATEQAKKLAAFTGRPESEVLMDIRFQLKTAKTEKLVTDTKTALVTLKDEYNAQGHDHKDIVAKQKAEMDKLPGLKNDVDVVKAKEKADLEAAIAKKGEDILAQARLTGTVSPALINKIADVTTRAEGIKELTTASGTKEQRAKALAAMQTLFPLLDDMEDLVAKLKVVVDAQLKIGDQMRSIIERCDRTNNIYNPVLLRDEMIKAIDEKVAKLDRVLTAQESEAYKAANKPVANGDIVQAKIDQLVSTIQYLNSVATPAQKITQAQNVINLFGLQGKIYGAVYTKYSSTMTDLERNHPQAGENACFTVAEQTANLSKVQVELQALIVELRNSIVTK